MTGKQSSAMDHAQKLIMKHGHDAKYAATLAGVHLNSIYRSKWWKEHRTKKEQKNG